MEWLHDRLVVTAAMVPTVWLMRSWSGGTGLFSTSVDGYPARFNGPLPPLRIRSLSAQLNQSGAPNRGVRIAIGTFHPMRPGSLDVLRVGISSALEPVRWEGAYPLNGGVYWQIWANAVLEDDEVELIAGYE